MILNSYITPSIKLPPSSHQSLNIMENSIPLILSFLGLFLYILKPFLSIYGKGKLNKLPPGPKPLPILGNILQLTDKPHNAWADLSRIYGPLMHVKLGSIDTLIVSSADMAREIFQKHDLAFSSRQVSDAVRAHNHNLHSMAWLPVSPKWRNLRKLAAIQLFSMKRLDASQQLRHKKVCEVLEYVGECCRNAQAVDIGQLGFTTSLNLLSNTFFSKDLAAYSSASSQEFKDIICNVMEYIGKPNLADFFPMIRYFDPLGIRRELAANFSKLFVVFDDMINQRMSANGANSCDDADVLDTLLWINQQDGSDLSLDDIKHLLIDFFAAGTDTTSSTLEWAMAELLRNPSKMKKAQIELNDIILDKHASSIQESDIKRLPYLQAIVKETLRLHPPAPLLVPHKARDDFDLCTYHIPKNTQVLVNVWAIGRDAETWQNPTEFLPERFLERGETDMRGRDFELIPFGAGRRICPGLPLAYRMVHIMLATLLHGFGWKLPNGMKGEDIDMNEKFGITLQKANPLLAVPVPK